MKIVYYLICVFLILFIVTNCKKSSSSVYNTQDTLKYSGNNDFHFVYPNYAPFYVDKGKRKGYLAINPMKYEDQWAKAGTVFKGQSGNYNIILKTYLEYDGESVYQLTAGNHHFPPQSNPAISGKPEEKPYQFVWNDIKVSEGDSLIVKVQSHSNKKVPEEGAPGNFGWSRGRWKSLEMIKTK